MQRNALCLASLKDGFFCNDKRVVRLGLVKGSGDLIQTGGNKVSDRVQVVLGLTSLVVGSQYNLGFLYEALLAVRPTSLVAWHSSSMSIRPSDLMTVLKGWKAYLDDEKAGLVDAMVIMFSSDGQGVLHAHCFADNSAHVLQTAMGLIGLPHDLLPTNKQTLYSYLESQQPKDGERLDALIPVAGLIKLLPEFIDGTLLNHGFTAHLLRDQTVFFSLNNADVIDPALLDKFTSSIIKRGGTLQAKRPVLDRISPYLTKRIMGEGSLAVQQSIKEAFDPNDVMLRNSCFLV